MEINYLIESMKTSSMETVSTGVLDKNEEHYLRIKDLSINDFVLLMHVIDYPRLYDMWNNIVRVAITDTTKIAKSWSRI